MSPCSAIPVVVVDDDAALRIGVAANLADDGHPVHQCEDPCPGLVIVLLTAYWTVEVEAAVAARPLVHLWHKPVDYEDLHVRIHELTSGRGSTIIPDGS